MTSKPDILLFDSNKARALRWGGALLVASLAGTWALSALTPEPARPAVSVIGSTAATPSDRGTELAMAWEQERRKRETSIAAGPALPRMAPSASASTEGPTSEQAREMAEMYEEYDSQLKPSASMPAWVQGRDFRANVASVDSNTTVQNVACSDSFCKLSLTTAAGGAQQQEVIERVGSAVLDNGGAVIYRYFDDKPQQFALYVMKPVPQPIAHGESVPAPMPPIGAEPSRQ